MDQQLKSIINKLANDESGSVLNFIAKDIVESNYTRGGVRAIVKWVVDQYNLNNKVVTQRLFNLIGKENVLYVMGLEVEKI